MAKRLMIATVTVKVPIYAENEATARRLACRHYRDENPEECTLRPYDHRYDLAMWGAIPWGEHEDRSVSHILKAAAAVATAEHDWSEGVGSCRRCSKIEDDAEFGEPCPATSGPAGGGA